MPTLSQSSVFILKNFFNNPLSAFGDLTTTIFILTTFPKQKYSCDYGGGAKQNRPKSSAKQNCQQHSSAG